MAVRNKRLFDLSEFQIFDLLSIFGFNDIRVRFHTLEGSRKAIVNHFRTHFQNHCNYSEMRRELILCSNLDRSEANESFSHDS